MEDEAVEEEDEAESESDDEDEEEPEEEEEDDANLKVDPEFRRRVAEALQVSGMGVDDDAEGDSDDESDEEVWDDDKMMQVDEQLAEVFRQRANAGKSSDFKRESKPFTEAGCMLIVRSAHPICPLQDSYSRLLRCLCAKAARQPHDPPHHGPPSSARFIRFYHRKGFVKQSGWYPSFAAQPTERSAHYRRRGDL